MSKFSDSQVISKQQVDRYPSRVVKIVTIKMKSISHHQHTTQVGKSKVSISRLHVHHSIIPFLLLPFPSFPLLLSQITSYPYQPNRKSPLSASLIHPSLHIHIHIHPPPTNQHITKRPPRPIITHVQTLYYLPPTQQQQQSYDSST